MDMHNLNPNDPFEFVIGRTTEAIRSDLAKKPLQQFERGLLTVKELADALNEIAEMEIWPLA